MTDLDKAALIFDLLDFEEQFAKYKETESCVPGALTPYEIARQNYVWAKGAADSGRVCQAMHNALTLALLAPG